MSEVYLGIGTNLGDRLNNLLDAIRALNKVGVEVKEYSSVYETPPWGFESPEPFYNMVVKAETELSPGELLKSIQELEKKLGREKKTVEGYESRIIDIDILFFDTKVINTDELKIPHAFFHQRLFVLIPLKELNPLFINELTGFTVQGHINNCKDKSEVSKAVTNIEFAKKIQETYGLKKK